MVDLKRLAFDKGLSQSGLGQILNVAQSQVSLMVNGLRKVTLEHIEMLRRQFPDIDSYIISDEAFSPKQTTATIVPFEVVEELKREREGVPYEDYIADIRRKDAQLTDLIAEIRNFSERESRLIAIIEKQH